MAGRAFDFKASRAICAPPVPVTAALCTRAALGPFHDDAGPSSRGERNPRPGSTFSRSSSGRARGTRPHGQRHPRAGHGCGRAGEVRPSGPADGRGRYRHRAVHALPQIRSGRSGLARPRPLRAVGRPRLDAALRAALSPRLRDDDDRRDQALPPARLAHRPAIPNTATRPASRPPPARSARASANAVGMAIAERHLAALFGGDIVDHRPTCSPPTAT